MALRTDTLFISSISYSNSNATYEINLNQIKSSKSTIQLFANSFCKGYTAIAIFQAGDRVHVQYDDSNRTLSAITVAMSTNVLPAQGSNTTKQRSARPQVYSENVYFYDFVTSSTNLNVLFVLRVTKSLSSTIVYDRYITKSTVFSAGLRNLKKGQELYIEFLSNAELLVVDVVEEETEIELKDLEESLEKILDEIKIEEDSSKWINLCKQSVMFVCSAKSRDHRRDCHFHRKSIGRYEECSFFRESCGGACDCIDAHAHLVEFGKAEIGTRGKQKEIDQSYDELLKERFGYKI